MSSPRSALAQGEATPRLTLVPSLGRAFGAGNGYTDAAVAGGLLLNRVEFRARLGAFIFAGGCDAIVPTKCGAGDGGYADGRLLVRLPDRPRAIGAWTIGAGGGLMTRRSRSYLTASLGRDFSIGHRGLVRLELQGRQALDDAYRLTWGAPLRQIGVGIGLGLWSGVDRL